MNTQLRQVSFYVTERATRRGFRTDSVTGESLDGWANFGQGAPEVGPISKRARAPPERPTGACSFEYAPTAGIRALRKQWPTSTMSCTDPALSWPHPSTPGRTCASPPGGRAGLTRVAAAVGDVNVGYFLPEYTAYEQLLSVFRRFVPIPTPLDRHHGYRVDEPRCSGKSAPIVG